MDGAPATPVPGPARSGATYAKDDSVTLEDGLALWVPELKDQKLQHVIQVCVEEMLTDFDDLVDMATSTEALIKQGFKKVVATKIMLALVKCGAKDAAAAHGEVASGSGGTPRNGGGYTINVFTFFTNKRRNGGSWCSRWLFQSRGRVGPERVRLL